MEEKPTVRLQPEVVQEPNSLPNPEPNATPTSVEPPVTPPSQASDTWGKFPPQVDRGPANKPSKGLMWIVILLIAVAVAIVGLAARQFLSQKDSVRTIVSEDSEPTPTEAPTPTPSPTPEVVEKSDVKIQVLNASGITGRAGRVADALKTIDFEDIDTGNADESNQVETVIEYSPKVDMKLVDEITAEVKEMFTNVRTIANNDLEDYHIVISAGTDESSE